MRLNECLHFLMASAQNREEALYRQLLEEYGVTPTQTGVLAALWEGAQTPKQIAEALRLEGPTVSGVLDRMEKKGLLTRTVNPANRREVRVALTPAGLALKEPVNAAIEETERRLLSRYSPEEAAAFKKILRALLEDTEIR